MHELSICQALIAKVEGIVRARSGQVRCIRVGIGPLSGVEPRLLEDAYPLACAGTGAEGSQLAIEHMNIRVRCRTCNAESEAMPNRLTCGACGDWHTDLLSGDELLLLQIDLETDDDQVEAQNV
jgi:hydrogenase nickel incorporation protein HypA/HybF